MTEGNEPKISVILPVYNSAGFLQEAIRSVIDQTFVEWELLIVDDGSTDGSLDIAEKFVETDGRIRLIARPHHGLVAALNTGLDSAQAPFVARMDADDISLPSRLDEQFTLFKRNPKLTVVSCQVRSFPEETVGEGMLVYEKWLNSLISDEEIKRDMFIESPLAHPSVMYRREPVILAGGYEDHGWPEDYDLWMKLFLEGAQFEKVPKVLYLWRDFPERLSRTGKAYSPAAFRKLKIHYLLRSYLGERREVTIWGAGRVGRWWCRELLTAGIGIKRFIDMDKKKIGGEVGGIPIQGAAILENHLPDEFILGCVGSRGARELIRNHLLELGLREIEDFLLIA